MTDTGMMLAYSQAVSKQIGTENEQLRAALLEALAIANGSGADFTWQARERLRMLARVASDRPQ